MRAHQYENPRAELETFKLEINLVHFAHSKGFEIDQKQSFRNGTVMRRGDEKICVARAPDNHWIFCDSKTGEGGSIVDFAQKLSGASLGHVRRELRVWVGEGRQRPNLGQYGAPRAISRLNAQSLVAQIASLEISEAHQYLDQERGIPRKVLTNSLFQNTVHVDTRGNCVFCHVDGEGITGFEMRNSNFRGFSKGGAKSLWRSNLVSPTKKIIFVESPIDAMSHYALKTPEGALYVATSGSLSLGGGELVKALVRQMKPIYGCVLATDNDEAGEQHAQKLREIISQAKTSVQCVREISDRKDWNEDLLALKSSQ